MKCLRNFHHICAHSVTPQQRAAPSPLLLHVSDINALSFASRRIIAQYRFKQHALSYSYAHRSLPRHKTASKSRIHGTRLNIFFSPPFFIFTLFTLYLYSCYVADDTVSLRRHKFAPVRSYYIAGDTMRKTMPLFNTVISLIPRPRCRRSPFMPTLMHIASVFFHFAFLRVFSPSCFAV